MAASEFKSTRMLLFAALMIALRVALKSVSIPVAANIRIGAGFLVNAFGSAVCGPVLSIAMGTLSDTLGCLLFPTGPYFFPFIFMEIAGSLVFALFFYRARITVMRVMLSRLCIDFFINIVLQTPVMYLYYQMVLGKSYAVFNLPRIVKNLVMFPIETVLLVLFFKVLVPPMRGTGYIRFDISEMRFTKKTTAALIALTILGIAAVALYVIYR